MESRRNVRELSIIFISFALVLSILIVVLEELFFAGVTEKLALKNAIKKSLEREDVFKEFIEHSEQNLLSIQKSIFFQNYLKEQSDSNQELLENIFLIYANSHSNIMQIRYIDRDGFEKIRVDRADEVNLISRENLQNKSNRYYFYYPKEKNLKGVWFSAMDLNVEHGRVEIPYKPTFRAILPIENSGEFDGILVINYYIKDFIKKITNTPLYDMILYNDKGETIYHYSRNSWGNSLDHHYNILEEYPEEVLSKPFLKTDSFVSRKLDLQIFGGVNIILKLKESYLTKQIEISKTQHITVSLLIFALSLILTFLIIKIFSRKLLNLEKIEKLNDTLNVASKVAQIGFWEYDAKRDIITWSDGVFDIFEIDDRDIEVTYERFLSYVPNREELQNEFSDSIEEHRDYFIIHQIVTEKGNTKFVEERGKHYFQKEVLIKTVGSVYDITTIYYSEKKFKSLLEYASDGIHIVDENGNLVNCSNSFIKNLGYSMREVKNMNLADWDAFVERKELVEYIAKLIDTPKTIETKHRKKDGSLIDVQINAKGIEIEGKRYLYASQRDITEQKRNLEKLETAKELYETERFKYKTILDLASDGIFFMDLDGNLIEYSKKTMELLGYSEEEMKRLTVYDWDRDIDAEGWKKMKETIHKISSISLERVHTRKDGSTYIAYITASLICINENSYIYSAVRDITEQKENQKRLEESEFRWKFAIEGNKDGLWDWNVKTNEVYFSPQWKKMLGFEIDEIQNSLDEWKKRVHPDDLDRVLKTLKEYFEGDAKTYVSEHRVLCKDGSYIWIRDRGVVVRRDGSGTAERMIGTHTDITEVVEATELLRKQSYVDELTKLKNRKAYNEKIEKLIEQFQRYKIIFSMMMFDIDFFKKVNDTYGHQVGDEVLIKFSQTVSETIRKSDYLFRIGGEEFVILLPNTNLKNATLSAEKVRKRVEEQVSVSDRKVTISIGVTEVFESDTVDSIFKRVDDNLYKAKDGGRNRVES